MTGTLEHESHPNFNSIGSLTTKITNGNKVQSTYELRAQVNSKPYESEPYYVDESHKYMT